MPRYRAFQHLEEYLVSNLPYRVHSINLEKAQPGRELWHGGDSRLHDDEVAKLLKHWTALHAWVRIQSSSIFLFTLGSERQKKFISNHQKVNLANAMYKIPKKGFRHRELNPGHLGESQVS